MRLHPVATLVVLLTAALVSGCESAESRCQRITTDALIAETLGRAEAQIDEAAAADLQRSGRSVADLSAFDSTRQALRAKARHGDTARHRPAPPRPSELAWAQEHCFEGHAR